MAAYYNENDPFCVEWLENLIKDGVIADGVVDRRPIQEVEPDDLKEFNQCHFFAGIGGWSWAFQLAGWNEDRTVWSGSCPCQPFSVAGRQGGEDDDRHLWPYWYILIAECRPPVVFGEQVASPLGRQWIDSVSADLEDVGYRVGSADLCAAGVGAPHLRQRLWWVADTDSQRPLREYPLLHGAGERRRGTANRVEATRSSKVGGVADTGSTGLEGRGVGRDRDSQRTAGESGMGGGLERVGVVSTERRDYWHPADWLYCNDPRGAVWRPVEPGSFPLVTRVPGDVGRIRAYGNSIVPPLAAVFIEAYVDVLNGG